MSECKICRDNGKPGVTILWDENIKSQKTGKLIPLETDRSYHRHYDPMNGSTNTSQSSSNSNPSPTIPAAKPREEVIEQAFALEALTLEFKTLLQHVTEYLKQATK